MGPAVLGWAALLILTGPSHISGAWAVSLSLRQLWFTQSFICSDQLGQFIRKKVVSHRESGIREDLLRLRLRTQMLSFSTTLCQLRKIQDQTQFKGCSNRQSFYRERCNVASNKTKTEGKMEIEGILQSICHTLTFFVLPLPKLQCSQFFSQTLFVPFFLFLGQFLCGFISHKFPKTNSKNLALLNFFYFYFPLH